VQSIITAIVLIAVAIVLPRRYEKFRKRLATRSKSVKHRPDTSSESESEESSSDESSDDDSESGERRSLRQGHRSHRGRDLPPTTGASRSHGMFSTMHMPSGVQLPSWASNFGVRGGHIST